MHSKEFKHIKGVSGKRAIVVGVGNSGGDCSVEISKYMRVYLATRRGAWILHRLMNDGIPWDIHVHNRARTYLKSWLPRWYRNKQWKRMLNAKCDHDLYCLTPAHEPDATHPTLNDELPDRIAAGMVVVKPNIRSFTEKGVIFEDGSFEDDIDLVVFATGYKVDYPYIDKSILDIKNNKVEMFRNMFLPDLSKQTIAFLALCQPLGAMFPIAETQTRLAARVFKGEVKLPSAEEMKKDIQMHTEALQKRYVDTERHTIQVDWLPFMDELAELVGCKPNLLKLLVTDPVLFYNVAFGPCVPFQYRLHGPNPWPGARQAILTSWDRIKKPFETRTIPKHQTEEKSSWIEFLLVTSLTAGVLAVGAQYAANNDLDYFKFLPFTLVFIILSAAVVQLWRKL